MRVTYLPEFYSSRELTACSAVATPLKLFEAMSSLETPEFATFCLPRTKGEFTWDDAVFAKPWLDARMIAQDRWYTQPMPPIDPDWLEELLPKKAKAPLMDYALTFRFTHSAAIATAFYAPRNKWRWVPEIPVVTWVSEIGDSPPIRSLHWQTLASASVGALLFLNELDRSEWLELLSVLVHPDEMPKLAARAFVVNAIADYAGVDRHAERYAAERERRRGGDVVVLHGGSWEGKRNLSKLVEAVEHLRFQGVPVAAKMFGPQPGAGIMFPPATSSDAIEIEFGLDHDAFLERLGEGDLAWCAIEWEGTALSVAEMIRSGMLPIWLDRPWVQPRLPAGYPLIAHDYDELETVTRFAVENLETLRTEWLPKYRAHMAGYGPGEAALRWRSTMEQVMVGPRARNLVAARLVQPAFDLLAKALEHEGWTEATDVHEVHAAISRQSRKGADFKYVSPTMLRWMFMALGWVDRCDRPGLSMAKP